MQHVNPSELIDFFGGTTKVAAFFNIKAPSVSGWREDGIPQDRLIRLAPVLESMPDTKWTRKSLFPNDWRAIWPEMSRRASKAKEAA